MELLDHNRNIYTFGTQITVRNLVSNLVKLHSSFPFVSGLVQNECQAVLEIQPRVFRILQTPRPAIPPLLVCLSQVDSIPASLIYLCFQLSPSQNKASLLVELLLIFDAAALLGLFSLVAQAFKKVVDLLVQGSDGIDVAHFRILFNQFSVTASRSSRRSAGTTCQFGTLKLEAISTIR